MRKILNIKQLANKVNRGPFTPHNTLASTDRPSFSQRRDKSPGKHHLQELDKSASANITPPELRARRNPAKSPASTTANSRILGDIGDSSSLFSYDSPAYFDFGSAVRPTNSNSPIPFVFGLSKDGSRHKNPPKSNKMVNERSPAKAPLHPVVANEQPPTRSDNSSKPTAQPDLFASRPPPSSVLHFGQPTLPHSPLNRGPPKQSSVFIQPKSRPEFHRDAERPGQSFLPLM